MPENRRLLGLVLYHRAYFEICGYWQPFFCFLEEQLAIAIRKTDTYMRYPCLICWENVIQN